MYMDIYVFLIKRWKVISKQKRKQSSCVSCTSERSGEKKVHIFGSVSSSNVRISTRPLVCCDFTHGLYYMY